MYTRSDFSGKVFRDSDNLDVTAIGNETEYQEYIDWLNLNNGPARVDYHPTEEQDYKNNLINNVMLDTVTNLSPTDGYLIRKIAENRNIPQWVTDQRAYFYAYEVTQILAIDPDYVFPENSAQRMAQENMFIK